jgi:hypothetical protein
MDLTWLLTNPCLSIDKSSSAELSEAINSMFKWYRDATVCYAFLIDVTENLEAVMYPMISSSRYFMRGWTLQELIAPRNVQFFDRNWIPLGTKATLGSLISSTTGIPNNILENMTNMWSTSIACRMSWASARTTTRAEDMAYCLLGIFGVNMPLLYGEGEKAFLRLQEEIIKMSDDQSIFAWDTGSARSAALAAWPSNFADSGNVVPIPRDPSAMPYTVTHMGLHITLTMLEFETSAYFGGHEIHMVLLQCQYRDDFTKQLVMYLRDTNTPHVFARCSYRGAYLGHIHVNRVPQAIAQPLYIESPWMALYDRPREAICLLTCDASLEILVARAKGVDVSWNPTSSSLRLKRTDASFTHDMAAGFVFSGIDGSARSFNFLVVLYFPPRSSVTTQLGGVKIYDKPDYWSAEEWIAKASNDLSLVHIQESITTQVTSTSRCCIAGGSAAVLVSARLEMMSVLNQQTYALQVITAASNGQTED